MEASCHGNIDIVKLLLDKGANVNVELESGNNALSFALTHFNIDIAELLRKYGAK